MRHIKWSSLLFQVSVVIFCLCFWPLTASPIYQRSHYEPTDNVTILNVSNFTENVVEDPNKAYIVEFYNSWCGDCQRFAPFWKKFAQSISNWRDIVVVVAVECSLDINAHLCREYEVSKYPALRFFPPNSPPGYFGEKLKELHQIKDLGHQAIEYLKKSATNKTAGPSWPSLEPTTDLTDAVSKLPPETKHIAVVFESKNSSLGAELILDYHLVKELGVFIVLDTNTKYVEELGVKEFPSLFVQERGSSKFEQLSVKNATRGDFFNATKHYLSKHSLHVADIEYNETVIIPERKPFDNSTIADKPFKPDLEMALRYMLFQELRTTKVFDGEKLMALQNILRVMNRYLPLNATGTELLKQFTETILDHKGPLTGDLYDEYIQPLETRTKEYLSEPGFYVNCEKSTGQQSCSLWLLFHTLTVRAHLKHLHVNDTDPQDVLNSINGYVKHFLGCEDCSNHFQAMAVTIKTEVNSFNSSVLWLWDAHNQANERLMNDPGRPKIQFPSEAKCPKCRVDGKWNKDEVLTHMKSIYTFPASAPKP